MLEGIFLRALGALRRQIDITRAVVAMRDLSFLLRMRRMERTAEYVGGSGRSAMTSDTVASPRRNRMSMTWRSRRVSASSVRWGDTSKPLEFGCVDFSTLNTGKVKGVCKSRSIVA